MPPRAPRMRYINQIKKERKKEIILRFYGRLGLGRWTIRSKHGKKLYHVTRFKARNPSKMVAHYKVEPEWLEVLDILNAEEEELLLKWQLQQVWQILPCFFQMYAQICQVKSRSG